MNIVKAPKTFQLGETASCNQFALVCKYRLVAALTRAMFIAALLNPCLSQPGTPQQKPKRVRICVDVSGSMYR